MTGAYFDHIRHVLSCQFSAPLIITDPIGYEESEEEFTRTFDNVGIVANFSADLKFIGTGKDYIQNVVKNHGLNEIITIKRQEKHPHTDEWMDMYESTLDLSTYKIENGECAVKINSGGFDKLFKSRETEKLEVEKTTSIDGDELPDLVTKNLLIEGRRIFLKTQYDVLESENETTLFNESDVGNKRGSTKPVPINKFSSSHDDAHSPIPDTEIGDNSDDRSAAGTTGLMFFVNTSNQIKTLTITLSISYKFDVLQYDDIDWARFWVRMAKYGGGTDYNYLSAINIFDGYVNEIPEGNKNHNWFGIIPLAPGQSLSLQFSQLMEGDDGHDNHLEIECSNIEASLVIEEDSFFPPTNTKCLLLHDLGERLTQLITGKQNKFKSDVLGRTELGYSQNGAWAFIGTYCGHWLRGFNPGDDLYKPYTTTFKDFVNTIKSVFNLHVGFQSVNNEEAVVVEPITYFFNPNIVLRLPNPLKNVKEYAAEELIFSGITLGYEKGAEVEGIMGLDEPNGQSNWISNMTVIKNGYEKIAKYIAGVYMEEKQRRYQKSDFPSEDKEQDKDIFLKDLKLAGSVLKERKWQDDFVSPPTGIFSPETAKNLRLSPAHNLRRHGNMVGVAFKQYLDKYLRFGSSTGNSSMTTFLAGETISENQDVLNGSLNNRLFEPFFIEGEHQIDFEVLTTLKGISTFNGVNVPNFYCKVEFTLEDDPQTLRYGYIMSVKPNGPGSWKFIEASNLTI